MTAPICTCAADDPYRAGPGIPAGYLPALRAQCQVHGGRRTAATDLKPAYDSEGIRLYEGDALTVLPQLDAESVDCVITDPPYNIGKDFGSGPAADRRKDYEQWLAEIWSHCGRLAKEGSFLVFTNRISYLPIGLLCAPDPWRFFHVEVWHKPLALAGVWYGVAPHWEPIFVYVKGKPWRPFRSPFVMSDVHEHNVETNRNGHPTVKPEGLIAGLMEHYAPLDGVVLDPFIGSGTTAVVAQRLGRRCIGIDMSMKFISGAIERLRYGLKGGQLIRQGQGLLL